MSCLAHVIWDPESNIIDKENCSVIGKRLLICGIITSKSLSNLSMTIVLELFEVRLSNSVVEIFKTKQSLSGVETFKIEYGP